MPAAATAKALGIEVEDLHELSRRLVTGRARPAVAAARWRRSAATDLQRLSGGQQMTPRGAYRARAHAYNYGVIATIRQIRHTG
jgi:hypothetical protein